MKLKKVGYQNHEVASREFEQPLKVYFPHVFTTLVIKIFFVLNCCATNNS